MCCGQKRLQQYSHAPRRERSDPQYVSVNLPPPASTSQTPISICYLETAPVRVQGLATGRSYEFSGSQPVQSVDARDASSLLNTRYFRRA
jgi:hypothetical protein